MGDVNIEILPTIAFITGLEFEARIARRVIKKTGSSDLVFVAGLGGPMADKVVAEAKKAGASGIVSFGVCGGIDPALPAGSVILPETILGPDELVVDMIWRDKLAALLNDSFDITTGSLLTVENTVETVEEKTALYQQTGTCAVDMESAHLARLAAKHDLPFIAVRVVHDPASRAIPPAFRDIIKSNGQLDGWKLVRNLIFKWPGAKVMQEMSGNNSQAQSNLEQLMTIWSRSRS